MIKVVIERILEEKDKWFIFAGGDFIGSFIADDYHIDEFLYEFTKNGEYVIKIPTAGTEIRA